MFAFYWKVKFTKRRRDKDLPSVASFPKWPQLSIFNCRELDGKWSSKDMKWHPYRILVHTSRGLYPIDSHASLIVVLHSFMYTFIFADEFCFLWAAFCILSCTFIIIFKLIHLTCASQNLVHLHSVLTITGSELVLFYFNFLFLQIFVECF